jgi:hypothetical protein
MATWQRRSFRPCIDVLEDRVLLSGGEWLLRLEGLSGTTLAEQMREAQALIDAQIPNGDIAVVDHTAMDGNIVIEAPEFATLGMLNDELQGLTGFIDVVPFQGEEEGARGATPSLGGSGLPGSPPPVESGANLAVGLFDNEVTLAVNPLNANNIVVANYNGGQPALKISLDGGATFPITGNAVLPPGQNSFGGDDSLAFDAQGRLFWTYLTRTIDFSPQNIVSLQVNPTAGAVIGSPSFVAQGNLDKEWIAADANPSSPFANNLYVVWSDLNQLNAPIRFARSTNQGATWTVLPGNLSGAGEGFTTPSEVAVAPNGDVWVAWHTNTGGSNGEVRMRRSTDGGVTFGPEIIPFPAGTAATTLNTASGVANKITGLHVLLAGSMQPRILIDPARPGNVYVVSVDDPDAFVPTNDPSDIVIARSADNGATWTRSTIGQGVYGDSEFMPAASIDADGNLAVTWYSNRRHRTVPDLLGGFHYLLDLYATTSMDGGLTFTAPVQINDPANTFDPERGAPDYFTSNHTMRIGEYNGLAVVNGTAHAVWTGNTATGQQVFYGQFSLGLGVTSTTPAIGSVVSTRPTNFTVNVSSPVNPAGLNAGDFKVNGIPADGHSYTPGTTTITFTYATSPVTAQGVQTMHIDTGAFTRASDGAPVLPFADTFRYDTVPLQVISTNPPFPNGTFTLPAPFTYDVTFNEPIDPASVQASDLLLFGIPGAAVTAVTVLPGNTTARFTLDGVTTEGTLNARLTADVVTDPFGNPGAAFSAGYAVDVGTASYPPLTGKDPPGSLIYDASATGVINSGNDTDNFTLRVDPGQTITVVVTPTAALRPTVALLNPSNGVVGSDTASAAGQRALIQTVGTAAGGTFTITVGAAGGTTGEYSVQVFLNAAQEVEGTLAGADNNTPAAAQDLGPSFVTLSTPQAGAARGAVLGRTDGVSYAAAAVTPTSVDISTTGNVSTATGDDSAQMLGAGQLAGFTFPFFGTTYTAIGFSTNGLITFPTGNTSFSNTDLSTAPPQAAIAALWDDLFNPDTGTGPTGSRIFWQVVGSGAGQQLIIQWNNVVQFSGTALFTFQAVLSANGNIQLNYWPGVTTDNVVDSATVGVKAAGTFNPARTLLSFNQPQGVFVGPNQSTLLTPQPPTTDYYRFTLNTGETASLAATGLGAGGLSLELRDGSDALLAKGVGAGNGARVISNFLTATTATYYVRVGGDANVPYSLVVTRNAAFDTEPNDTAATAQALGGNQGALGFVRGGNSVAFDFESGQQGFTINNNLRGTEPSAGLWHLSTRLGTQPGHSPVTSFSYGSEITGTYDTGAANAGSITTPVITLGTSSPTLSFNYVLQTEGNGIFDAASVQVSTNNFATFTTVLASTSSSLPLSSTWRTATADLSAFAGQNIQLRFLFDTVDGLFNTFEGWYVDDVQVGVNPDEDWYAITIPADGNPLRLQTSTSADGPGKPGNALDPHLELYDGTGLTLVASGLPLSDGRNEFLAVSGLTPGATYRVRVSGAGGSQGEYFLSKNFAPLVSGLGVTSPVNEGDSVTLTGTISDPDGLDRHTVVINWGPGEGSTTLTLAAGQLTFTAAHRYRDDNPTATAADLYSVSVTVTDNHGASATGDTSVTVNNLAPAVGPLSGPSPGAGVRGQLLSFTGAFIDAGEQDSHTTAFDWGDGSSSPASVVEANGAGSVSASHVYTAGGTYTVTLTVRDDDLGVTQVTKTITVVAAALQPDPNIPGGTVLAVGGTTGNDTLVIHPVGNAGRLEVLLDGASLGTYAPTGRLLVYGQAGDDNIEVAGSVGNAAWLFGGDGNDRLAGGAGANVLVGGRGNDHLLGGGGRDLLIGGDGLDQLVGNGGDDLLIGGRTAFDADEAALWALMAEWTSAREYEVRVANLNGTGSGPRSNGNIFLKAAGSGVTVQGDGVEDRLTGSSGRDWFFVGLGDLLADGKDDERIN